MSKLNELERRLAALKTKLAQWKVDDEGKEKELHQLIQRSDESYASYWKLTGERKHELARACASRPPLTALDTELKRLESAQPQIEDLTLSSANRKQLFEITLLYSAAGNTTRTYSLTGIRQRVRELFDAARSWMNAGGTDPETVREKYTKLADGGEVQFVDSDVYAGFRFPHSEAASAIYAYGEELSKVVSAARDGVSYRHSEDAEKASMRKVHSWTASIKKFLSKLYEQGGKEFTASLKTASQRQAISSASDESLNCFHWYQDKASQLHRIRGPLLTLSREVRDLEADMKRLKSAKKSEILQYLSDQYDLYRSVEYRDYDRKWSKSKGTGDFGEWHEHKQEIDKAFSGVAEAIMADKAKDSDTRHRSKCPLDWCIPEKTLDRLFLSVEIQKRWGQDLQKQHSRWMDTEVGKLYAELYRHAKAMLPGNWSKSCGCAVDKALKKVKTRIQKAFSYFESDDFIDRARNIVGSCPVTYIEEQIRYLTGLTAGLPGFGIKPHALFEKLLQRYFAGRAGEYFNDLYFLVKEQPADNICWSDGVTSVKTNALQDLIMLDAPPLSSPSLSGQDHHFPANYLSCLKDPLARIDTLWLILRIQLFLDPSKIRPCPNPKKAYVDLIKDIQAQDIRGVLKDPEKLLEFQTKLIMVLTTVIGAKKDPSTEQSQQLLGDILVDASVASRAEVDSALKWAREQLAKLKRKAPVEEEAEQVGRELQKDGNSDNAKFLGTFVRSLAPIGKNKAIKDTSIKVGSAVIKRCFLSYKGAGKEADSLPDFSGPLEGLIALATVSLAVYNLTQYWQKTHVTDQDRISALSDLATLVAALEDLIGIAWQVTAHFRPQFAVKFGKVFTARMAFQIAGVFADAFLFVVDLLEVYKSVGRGRSSKLPFDLGIALGSGLVAAGAAITMFAAEGVLLVCAIPVAGWALVAIGLVIGLVAVVWAAISESVEKEKKLESWYDALGKLYINGPQDDGDDIFRLQWFHGPEKLYARFWDCDSNNGDDALAYGGKKCLELEVDKLGRAVIPFKTLNDKLAKSLFKDREGVFSDCVELYVEVGADKDFSGGTWKSEYWDCGLAVDKSARTAHILTGSPGGRSGLD